MLITGILIIILSNAVTLRRDKSILYAKTTMVLAFLCLIISIDIFYIDLFNQGVELYSGTIYTNVVTHIFHIFLFLISFLILQLNSFYPRKVWTTHTNFLLNLISNNLKYFNSFILNKMSQSKILEYPLIIIFALLGGIFLISSGDLISIFTSIELQNYASYILCALYRNSEGSLSGSLIYFLLSGLSSFLVLNKMSQQYRILKYPFIIFGVLGIFLIWSDDLISIFTSTITSIYLYLDSVGSSILTYYGLEEDNQLIGTLDNLSLFEIKFPSLAVIGMEQSSSYGNLNETGITTLFSESGGNSDGKGNVPESTSTGQNPSQHSETGITGPPQSTSVQPSDTSVTGQSASQSSYSGGIPLPHSVSQPSESGGVDLPQNASQSSDTDKTGPSDKQQEFEERDWSSTPEADPQPGTGETPEAGAQPSTGETGAVSKNTQELAKGKAVHPWDIENKEERIEFFQKQADVAEKHTDRIQIEIAKARGNGDDPQRIQELHEQWDQAKEAEDNYQRELYLALRGGIGNPENTVDPIPSWGQLSAIESIDKIMGLPSKNPDVEHSSSENEESEPEDEDD